jgi:Tat protein secretion system quality control protein TatD with DNase activity
MVGADATGLVEVVLGATDEPFPWDIGVYDAHCHPTDVMGSTDRIAAMNTRALAIMATRAQDQEAVASVAKTMGITSREEFATAAGTKKLIPAFGWHPWFSHMIIDDASENLTGSMSELKKNHYTKVLSPPPDNDFIAHLPNPLPLSTFLEETKRRLQSHPCALVGEIGLDKAFRLPQIWTAEDEANRDTTLTPGGREGRRLSHHLVDIEHQKTILKAQLNLAGEMMRPVSVHGVAAHGILHDLIASTWKGHEKPVISARERKHIAPHAEDWSSASEGDDHDEDHDEDHDVNPGQRIYKKKSKVPKSNELKPMPFPPRICLHSYTGPHQFVSQYLKRTAPADVYFSFSACVNLTSESVAAKLETVLMAIPDHRILVESDLHAAGDEMEQELERIVRLVCKIKGWGLRKGVEKLAKNFEAFIFG